MDCCLVTDTDVKVRFSITNRNAKKAVKWYAVYNIIFVKFGGMRLNQIVLQLSTGHR